MYRVRKIKAENFYFEGILEFCGGDGGGRRFFLYSSDSKIFLVFQITRKIFLVGFLKFE